MADLCASSEFDLLILDLHMPAPDGFAILERLARADGREEDMCPVLVLTADASARGEAARARRLGASDFLTKPLDAVEAAAADP